MIPCGWSSTGGDGGCVPNRKGGGETLLTDLRAVSVPVLQQDAWRWRWKWRQEGVREGDCGVQRRGKAAPSVGVAEWGFSSDRSPPSQASKSEKGAQLPPTSFTFPPSPSMLGCSQQVLSITMGKIPQREKGKKKEPTPKLSLYLH